jgi:SAM-dependent methyltransferase
MRDKISKGYNAAATPEFVADYEAIPIEVFYNGVLDLFPQKTSKIIDIGAGTGRDAGWLANLGHDVTAVEPSKKLLSAAKAIHQQANITWVNDFLPELSWFPNENQFDLFLLSGVWQHINERERQIAFKKFTRICAPNCRIIMALRHGKASPNRPVFAIDPNDTIAEAHKNGFEVLRKYEAASIRKQNIENGVTWTWLALEKPS